jgi:hypothetical protein
MMHVEPGGQEFLRMHPASYVLLPRDSALAKILVAGGGWRQVYGDDVAVVLDGRADESMRGTRSGN